MRIGWKKAKEVLDFLARRAGYENACIKRHWHEHCLLCITFCASAEFRGKSWNDYAEVMIKDNGCMQTFCLNSRKTKAKLRHEEHALKTLLKHSSRVYVSMGDKPAPMLAASGAWRRVFLDNECLESLLMQIDLEGQQR